MKKLLLTTSLVLLLSGCQTAYYSAMEKVGIHKRDILIDRVEEAKESQQASQQEFQSALERLSLLINLEGGELQTVYSQLNDDYESSQKAADDVSNRIDKVEDVANALFVEWNDELAQYQNPSLKRESEKKLNSTKRQFEKLLKSMRTSEKKMGPVLAALKDNVLYLKHNLNAQAVSAIKGEFNNLKRDIQSLMTDMNKSIADSNQFIEQMNKSS
ncbi:DUF2959 domain-containing protein [Pseudoalteromonas tunicata]|uniref:Type IV secretion system putative lipoprotein virB7 n=1 Tax=Pseudoalteromonas tunicata D2 TaxID=87626 RepID=A4C7U1_9GAMM|nr:DUF2959 domain-containing protein [Pseudoalteromonas tunicata]ATC93162.1 hypothetical protein PTUN_a0355 [Pseudoalteromonas tunicata]AXT32231.1 DUF2959 domain-containing protein [Pseudoalteromonas tunicata]EAR28656.1 hypothetical protein PTD2_06429 [Pseudoalteromonas tunicata D2]